MTLGITVWDLRDDGEWQCTARWRNHLGPIWRVTWAHPEFGQVIATCSFDRAIVIWEEVTGQVSCIPFSNFHALMWSYNFLATFL
ncbi:unnamed protein product [Protopolystoma xenopodis]|uniref:Uncharacterized protein n=1 Tax=Protopolystoma xenopodis TaxID=117903 RepID=A0A448XMU6_9PLAT|nr:unnamed protein product [Protopolystoma xenopodis]